MFFLSWQLINHKHLALHGMVLIWYYTLVLTWYYMELLRIIWYYIINSSIKYLELWR